ncbi:MAG: dihydrolipoamide dehydrogenase [Pseudomonadota bacterium]|nr:dihydrolipoamide dehydrogenase [Pseudomonadota bacterium]
MDFDVVVIGGGPGGYVAAIRASQLGFKVACVDGYIKGGKYSLGGTCLNVGCIPSKALLQSSENYAQLSHDFGEHGITCTNPQIDIAKMLARKNNIVNKNASGISFLFKKNKITELHGWASFAGNNDGKWQISIDDKGSLSTVSAANVIIATGSSPRSLPQLKIDNKNILDNEGALDLPSVPKELCIIGAGVIGLEMGSVWKRLGSNVTVLEAMDKFLGAADEQVSKELYKNLVKQGLVIKNGVKIGDISDNNNEKSEQKAQNAQITINYEENGQQNKLVCDKLIVAVGRVPNTNGLGADIVGLKLDERGFIAVDDECRTNLANVWAIGDCVRGPMLAHKASEEGIIVAERVAGQHPHFDFNTVPWVIYTNPEVAWVGKTEQQLKDSSIAYKKGVASFMANGRALGLGNNIGFVKMLACSETDRILGVHMVGPFVSELISEVVVAMEFMASSEDLARIIHAHPSLSEVTHEAALACDNRQLHG